MGALKNQLKTDLVTAMKAKDELAKSTIRMAMSALHTEEVAGDEARELSDAEELAVITKEVAKRKDSAEAYVSGGRQELADKELAEADYLSRYLPTPLTQDEVKAIVDEEVAKLESPSMKQMGQVIKAVQARSEGRSDGRTISTLVKAALA